MDRPRKMEIIVQNSHCHVLLFATPWTGVLCPSLSPWVCSNLCPLNRWCYPTISSSVTPFSSCPQSFPAAWSFPVSWLFASGGSKYWSFSFSISPPSEYSGLVSFRMDWFDLLAVQGTLQECSPAPQFESSNSLVPSLLYGPAFTSVHDY